VEGEADRLRRAAGVAGAWLPHGGRALALVGTASGNGRGAARSRPDATLGWAERGAREQRALLQAGPASAVGREARRRPVKGEKKFSNYIFKKFSNTSFQISF